ncbi:hypothetical protein PAECIP111893_03912 [Paenibacillus plantiphilus]|uniref:DUF4825 domain-containing protein n=1 Tax=Paenibacillus plantiphilus TaxID=2905650 RepID=A0ABM9CKJ3_9BACL|nr:IseA DL-endopeptidase inhibitor family protein [Paenibacillus plantiphilus]CAH1215288.1 hypothetical protein PAECIP111893_03912 [Paenibacillus plantiphilus]
MKRVIAAFAVLVLLLTACKETSQQGHEVENRPKAESADSIKHDINKTDIYHLRMKAERANQDIFQSSEAWNCSKDTEPEIAIPSDSNGQFDIYYMCSKFDTREKMMSHLTKAFTKETAAAMIDQHIDSGLMAEVKGRMGIAPYEGVPSLDWDEAEVVELTTGRNEAQAVFKVWDPADEAHYTFMTTYIYESGWKEEQLIKTAAESAPPDSSEDEASAEEDDEAAKLKTVNEQLCRDTLAHGDLDQAVEQYDDTYSEQQLDLSEAGQDMMFIAIGDCFQEETVRLTADNAGLLNRSEAMFESLAEINNTMVTIEHLYYGGGTMYTHVGIRNIGVYRYNMNQYVKKIQGGDAKAAVEAYDMEWVEIDKGLDDLRAIHFAEQEYLQGIKTKEEFAEMQGELEAAVQSIEHEIDELKTLLNGKNDAEVEVLESITGRIQVMDFDTME